MPYNDLSARRFWSARQSYRSQQWTEVALLDKANSLALRLLALNLIIKERTGVPLFTRALQQGLLALTETTGAGDAKEPKAEGSEEHQPGASRVRTH